MGTTGPNAGRELTAGGAVVAGAESGRRRPRASGPRLGLVCVTSSDECRFRTITRSRFLALPPTARRAALEELYWANLGRLHCALTFCRREVVRLYRATSELFP